MLQQPSYASIYPVGQGLALAAGQLVFGNPWAGVVLSIAGFVSLVFWMLRGWVSPGWAFVGGLLAVFEFGPLSPWMNNYWGGGVAAMAGCLVFGALPRLVRGGRMRDAAILGAGLGLHLLARPYESLFLAGSVVVFLAPAFRVVRRALPVAVAVALPAAGLILVQNRAVTGSWSTLPAVLSRYEYGTPTTFTFQPVPVPHRALTPEQEMSYRSQVSYHGEGADTVRRYLVRLWFRMRVYGFFFLPALSVARLAFLVRLREPRTRLGGGDGGSVRARVELLSVLLSALLAALACLFVLARSSGCKSGRGAWRS